MGNDVIGSGWIRTTEGIRRQIYSLLPLSARAHSRATNREGYRIILIGSSGRPAQKGGPPGRLGSGVVVSPTTKSPRASRVVAPSCSARSRCGAHLDAGLSNTMFTGPSAWLVTIMCARKTPSATLPPWAFSASISCRWMGSAASGGAADENSWQTFTFDPGLLVAGPNLIAVEVHQANLTSSDVSFDLGQPPAMTGAFAVPQGSRF